MCTFRFKVEMSVCVCNNIWRSRSRLREYGNQIGEALESRVSISRESRRRVLILRSPVCLPRFLKRSHLLLSFSFLSDFRPTESLRRSINPFSHEIFGIFFWPRKVYFLGELFLEHTLDRCRRRVLLFPPRDSYDVTNNFCDWKIAFEAEKNTFGEPTRGKWQNFSVK